ncbi:coenzyme F420-0:L-glutamate ligase, partial [Microbacterium terrae]
NTPDGTILLLPVDPDASARAIAAGLRARLGVEVGVIVSDTLGRAWRDGQTDHAIGAGGVRVFEDLRGTTDAEGRPLTVTLPCVADELAAATDLVKGKAARLPVAVVRGRADLVGPLDLPGARSIVRALETDMFRQGADEAYADGFAAGAASRAV